MYYRKDKPGEYFTTIYAPPVIGTVTICTHWAVDEVSSVNKMFRYVEIKQSNLPGVEFEIELEPFNPILN
jgi:hypothetical protein